MKQLVFHALAQVGLMGALLQGWALQGCARQRESAVASPAHGSAPTAQTPATPAVSGAETPPDDLLLTKHETTRNGSASKSAVAPPERAGVVETRTSAVISEVIQSHRQMMRDCYETFLSTNPGVSGDVTIRFVVNRKGAVRSAEADLERSSLHDPDLGECLSQAVRSLEFPPSSRGLEATVSYPFNFKAGTARPATSRQEQPRNP